MAAWPVGADGHRALGAGSWGYGRYRCGQRARKLRKSACVEGWRACKRVEGLTGSSDSASGEVIAGEELMARACGGAMRHDVLLGWESDPYGPSVCYCVRGC